jgi:PBP1b-binding outer membrane lipoprotein LpoB
MKKSMKKLLSTLTIALLALALGGCLASTYSPDGVNCNYSQGKPLWEMPLDCQGH